jgi:hypothetical protein
MAILFSYLSGQGSAKRIPLSPFCGIVFPLELAHIAMEGEGGRLLMTAAREAGSNGSGGGIGEGDQWGGRSVHADGGGRDMADEVGGQWGEMSFGCVC